MQVESNLHHQMDLWWESREMATKTRHKSSVGALVPNQVHTLFVGLKPNLPPQVRFCDVVRRLPRRTHPSHCLL